MTVTGIITAIVTGSIIGALGRLVVPGRTSIPIWLTIVIGVVAAFVGTFFAAALGLSTSTPGIDWGELIVQIVIAATGVFVVAGMYVRRGVRLPTSEPQFSRSSFPPTSTGQRNDPVTQDVPRQPVTPQPVTRPVPEREPAFRAASPRRTKVFLSYRRSDNPHAVRGVADRLRRQFGAGEVFMDVDSIAPGIDFLEGVRQAISGSAVMLVLIGERWLDARDSRHDRRLDDPADNVRMEIEQALQFQCRILPVLVDQATMPHPQELPPSLEPLQRINAIRVRHDSWEDDVAKLTRAVAQMRPDT